MAPPPTEVALTESGLADVTAATEPPVSTPPTAPPNPPPAVAASANAWWLLGPGVSFPADAKGVRSTTRPAKSVWAAAALGLQTTEGAALAADLLHEKDWRHKYFTYAVRLAELQAIASPEKCISSCKAGLDAAAVTFEWRRGDKACTLQNAMRDASCDAPKGRGLRTAVVRGVTRNEGTREDTKKSTSSTSTGSKDGPDFHSVLHGAAVTARATGWVTSGCAEPDIVPALDALHENSKKWAGSYLTDTLFVLLGGTSELCPLRPLLNVGANVACVARQSPKLRDAAETASKSNGGTLFIPVAQLDLEAGSDSTEDAEEGGDSIDESTSSDQISFENGESLDAQTFASAGANLITQTPEIRTWIVDVTTRFGFKNVVIGSYAYQDGEAHVRTSVASDVITRDLCERWGPGSNEAVCVSVSFLSSPGTAFPIPAASWEDANERFMESEKNDGMFHWRKVVGVLSGGFGFEYTPSCREPVFRPVTHRDDATDATSKETSRTSEKKTQKKTPVYVHDGHLVLQGPNYALAKTLQNWRSVVSGGHGVCVSANMAPGSRTRSMQHVPVVAKALEGQKHFAPLRPFDVFETRDTMTSLMLHDLGRFRDNKGDTVDTSKHPMDVFGTTAVHGGTWRCPWSVESIGRASVVAGTLWG